MGFLLASGMLAVSPAARAQLFLDVSAAAGLASYQSATGAMATGAAAADYDGDGLVDVYVPTSESTPNRLYRNLGGGTFEEIAAQVGLESPGVSRVALWFDYDGDGDLDLVVGGDCRQDACAAGESTLRLYRQNSPQSFTDVTVAAGLYAESRFLGELAHRSGLAAGDLDNDGDLDLYAGIWASPAAKLYFNAGDGTFVDASVTSGADSPDYHWQSVMHDFNGDGWLDIFVAIDFTRNHLWINQRDGSFCDAGVSAGVDGAFNEMGVALGDYENDGDFDIYITNIHRNSKYNRLYRNDGMIADCCGGGSDPPAVSCPSFTDVATSLGVEDTDWGWGVTFIDGDNEGLLDIAATNGFFQPPWSIDPSKYFENQGGSPVSFAEASAGVGFDDTYWGSALLAFDCDRDGDLDLVQSSLTNAGEPARLRLLENQLELSGPANAYLNVRPRMAGPNTHAIGTVVRVRTGTVEQMRLITAGTSLLGQEPAEAFFGLGTAVIADELSISWPDGVGSRFDQVAVDRLLDVSRGSPADVRVSLEDGAAELDAPGALTYTLQVENLGPGDVTGAVVEVALPTELSCGGWSCVPSGAGCTVAAPAGDLTDVVDLLVGGSLTYTVDCTVPEGTPGALLVAGATVAGPAESPDPSPADNAATDVTVITGAGACGDPDHRYLVDLTVADQQLYRACSSITVEDVTVESVGDLILDAPEVSLRNGLAVSGALAAGFLP